MTSFKKLAWTFIETHSEVFCSTVKWDCVAVHDMKPRNWYFVTFVTNMVMKCVILMKNDKEPWLCTKLSIATALHEILQWEYNNSWQYNDWKDSVVKLFYVTFSLDFLAFSS